MEAMVSGTRLKGEGPKFEDLKDDLRKAARLRRQIEDIQRDHDRLTELLIQLKGELVQAEAEFVERSKRVEGL
jgi:hypothetical protein